VIRIIHRDWPDSIERFRLTSATGLNKLVTDQDIKAFRIAHSVSFIGPVSGVTMPHQGWGLRQLELVLE